MMPLWTHYFHLHRRWPPWISMATEVSAWPWPSRRRRRSASRNTPIGSSRDVWCWAPWTSNFATAFRSSAQYIQCIATKNITNKTWPRAQGSSFEAWLRLCVGVWLICFTCIWQVCQRMWRELEALLSMRTSKKFLQDTQYIWSEFPDKMTRALWRGHPSDQQLSNLDDC